MTSMDYLVRSYMTSMDYLVKEVPAKIKVALHCEQRPSLNLVFMRILNKKHKGNDRLNLRVNKHSHKAKEK